MTPMQRTQHGFAAIAAIFLVVVLAALGGFMLTFSNTQQLTSAQDIQGSRAYWAARAGLEWGLAKVPADPALCPATTLASLVPTAGTPVLLSGVDGFTLAIQCARNVYAEGADSVVIYQLNVVAHTDGPAVGSVGYIERSLSASTEAAH
jgi:MSHA biogenesis protein MshP